VLEARSSELEWAEVPHPTPVRGDLSLRVYAAELLVTTDSLWLLQATDSTWSKRHAYSRSDVAELAFTGRSNKRWRSFLIGFVPGAVVGGVVFGWLANQFCASPDCNKKIANASGVGVLVGGIPFGILGAVIGTREITIYRFAGGNLSATESGLSLRLDLGK
jgi:hypothetical protein